MLGRWAEGPVEHILLVADQDGQVAHVRVHAQVVDVLGVLLPGAPELHRRGILAHR
jgi:hypothetical protein